MLRPILVFCSFNKKSETLSTFLKQNGKNSFTFHGQMTEVQKLTVLEDLSQVKGVEKQGVFREVDVIIATISLSMGLDVSSIKGVVHFNLPKFIEGFIQQIGRSGRDGKVSNCVALVNKDDFYF